MRKIFAVLLLIFVLGCSSPSYDNGDIPIDLNKGLPIIEVVLNGKSARLLVDSGASLSILNVDSAEDYGFDYKIVDGNLVSGIGGSTVSGIVTGAKVFHGGTRMRIRFKCIDIRRVSSKLNIVGLVGSDYLIANGLIIDYNNKVIRKE